MILAKSAPGNLERRQNWRSIWEQLVLKDRFYTYHILQRQLFFSFVSGKSGESVLDGAVDEESRFYGDMLLGDFDDRSDKQTALKLIWSLHWLRVNLKFSFLLMTNDESFVNYFSLVQWLVVGPVRKLYAGQSKIIVLEERGPLIDWFSARNMQRPDHGPGPFSTYYHQGFGYILSCDLVEEAVRLTRGIPLVGADDVMMGMLMHLAGIARVNSARFHAEPLSCEKSTSEGAHPLVIGNVGANNSVRFLKDVMNVGCPVCEGKKAKKSKQKWRRVIYYRRRHRHG